MPAVQKHFEDFHSKIKLDNDDEKAKLREKRDILISALVKGLDEDVPKFETFNQGSYSMHTGVVPLDGNYDIDVGVIFDCDQNTYPDPVILKKKVYAALNSHSSRTVQIRRPCVTVHYISNGETDYHIDLVLYTKNSNGLLAIGKGKENSSEEFRFWEDADPKELTNLICTAFTDSSHLAQYRRCIRYIKRWRDVQFRNGGAPLSIALTIAARDWFKPHFESSRKPADLLALLNWVSTILKKFEWSPRNGEAVEALKVDLPVTPGGDLMERMSNKQMAAFKQKLEALQKSLESAYDEDLPEDACKILKKQFGDDFIVPEKAETAKVVTRPVISTGSSA